MLVLHGGDVNPAARRVLLGRGDDGLMHVPEEPRMFSGEAACAPLFSENPISVEVMHCEVDTPVTCLACIARHLDKLWTVLAGTIMRVDVS